MPTSPDARARAAATYDAAADFFDHEANSFWERYGAQTVESLQLSPGSRVYDACCGSGASALPAARAVGPAGAVLGVDVSENLLARARAKAAAAGLHNARFRSGDAFDPGEPAGSFDAVICVFGIFFAADMPGAVRGLWRLVAPGGRLAITTWGPDLWEPLSSMFWDAVRELRPELCRAFNPWDLIVRPEALRALHAESGLPVPEVSAVSGMHPVISADAAWALVLGSGYRGTVDQLDGKQQAALRETVLARWLASAAREVRADVLYAVTTRR